MEEEKNSNPTEGLNKSTREHRARQSMKSWWDKLTRNPKKTVRKIIMPFIIKAAIFMLFVAGIALLGLVIVAAVEGLLTRGVASDISESRGSMHSSIGRGMNSLGLEEGDFRIAIVRNTDTGMYTFEHNFEPEEIAEFAEILGENGINFEEMTRQELRSITPFEIVFLAMLHEHGLDLSEYCIEGLRTLILFEKAALSTQHLDIRTTEQVNQGSIEEPPEEGFFGTIQVTKTTRGNTDNTTRLEYMPLEEFQEQIEENDQNVLNFFSIDEYENLVIAGWSSFESEYEFDDGEAPYRYRPEGDPPGEPRTYTMEEVRVPYQSLVNRHTMPFDFLVAILTVSNNIPFGRDVAMLAFNSRIVVNVREVLTETQTVETQDFAILSNIHREREDTSGPGPIDTVRRSGWHQTDEFTIVNRSIRRTNNYSFALTEIYTWFKHAHIVYGPMVRGDEYVTNNNENPFIVYTPASEASRSQDQVESPIVAVYTRTNSETRVETIRVVYEAPETHIELTQRIFAVNPETEEFEKFLAIYDENEYAQNNVFSGEFLLYDMLEQNENTIDFADKLRYLFFRHDDEYRGVTLENFEEMLNIFRDHQFITIGSGGGGSLESFLAVWEGRGNPRLYDEHGNYRAHYCSAHAREEGFRTIGYGVVPMYHYRRFERRGIMDSRSWQDGDVPVLINPRATNQVIDEIKQEQINEWRSEIQRQAARYQPPLTSYQIDALMAVRYQFGNTGNFFTRQGVTGVWERYHNQPDRLREEFRIINRAGNWGSRPFIDNPSIGRAEANWILFSEGRYTDQRGNEVAPREGTGGGSWIWPVGSRQTETRGGRLFAIGAPSTGSALGCGFVASGRRCCGIHPTGHGGIDIPNAGRGDNYHNIVAVASGEVRIVQRNVRIGGHPLPAGVPGWGNHIIINHGNGIESIYAHLTYGSIPANIRRGERVEQGQVLGRMGSTGHSTGPHLHFERTENGNRVDPMRHLTRP